MGLSDVERGVIPSRLDDKRYVMIFSQGASFPDSEFRVCFAVLLERNLGYYLLGNPRFCDTDIAPEDGVNQVIADEARGRRTMKLGVDLVGTLAELGVD